jgi:hypothetical protein
MGRYLRDKRCFSSGESDCWVVEVGSTEEELERGPERRLGSSSLGPTLARLTVAVYLSA